MVKINQKKLKSLNNETRKSEILARLEEIDKEVLRPLRAVISGKNTAFDDDKLSKLESEAILLRLEYGKL